MFPTRIPNPYVLTLSAQFLYALPPCHDLLGRLALWAGGMTCRAQRLCHATTGEGNTRRKKRTQTGNAYTNAKRKKRTPNTNAKSADNRQRKRRTARRVRAECAQSAAANCGRGRPGERSVFRGVECAACCAPCSGRFCVGAPAVAWADGGKTDWADRRAVVVGIVIRTLYITTAEWALGSGQGTRGKYTNCTIAPTRVNCIIPIAVALRTVLYPFP